MAAPVSNIRAAVTFLIAWRPDGPWLVIEIDPNVDNPLPKAYEFTDEAALAAYLTARSGIVNLYYVPNYSVPYYYKGIRTSPRKIDITHATALFADLDLTKGTLPSEHAFLELYERINALTQPPTINVFSGGGYQPKWNFPEPIPIAEVPGILDRLEAAGKSIAKELRSDAVQNINRLLRLPGTINIPNAAKAARGRVPTLATVVSQDWSRTWSYETDPVPHLPDDYYVDAPTQAQAQANDRDPPRASIDLPSKWKRLVDSGDATDYANDRSRLVFAFVCALLRRGWVEADILPFLVEERYGMSAHCRAQPNSIQVARRQIERARERMVASWEYTSHGKIDGYSPKNIRMALQQQGIALSHDTFEGRTYINGSGPSMYLDDAAESQLVINTYDKFGFLISKPLLTDVTTTLALANSYNPVRDYLSRTQPTWDGIHRTTTWLIDIAGANDTPLVRAVSQLILIAAVRRVRQPGCKFDEILVLISERQGTNKSTALSILAVNPEWFTDDLPLHADAKKVIEQTRGKWLVECADLSGVRQAEIEAIKTLFSRGKDEARLAYGHHPLVVPRQWVPFGTTNLTAFLRDTENRRFWPVFITQFDLRTLMLVRDQLWAEAATLESQGVSIRLDESLWSAAAEVQEEARYGDPWTDALIGHLGGLTGRIAANDVWILLGKPTHQRGSPDSGRLTQTMSELGWTRKMARLGGAPVRSFVKGTEEEQSRIVYVFLDDPILRTYRVSTSPSPTLDEMNNQSY